MPSTQEGDDIAGPILPPRGEMTCPGNWASRMMGAALVIFIFGCIGDFPGIHEACIVEEGCAEGLYCSPDDNFICMPDNEVGVSDDSQPDSTNNPRDGGTDSVSTDMAAPDARPGDAEQTDADVGPEADRGVCPYYRPEGEICDGNDNDCDGRTDEGLPLNCCGQCGDARNTCNLPDQQRMCAADAGVQDDADPADAEVLPPADLGVNEDQGAQCDDPEVCDGEDNDCDGRTDEGLRNACEQCGPTPVEICDGVDNDCDGNIDNVVNGFTCNCLPGQEPEQRRECYSGPEGTRGEGACTVGLQTCTPGGTWGVCEGEILPQNEVCDGIDNNCNGRVDELPPGPAQCFIGVGSCTRQGARVCDAEHGPEVVCNAEEGLPSPELCDRRDNDCDGSTDEDFERLGGACEVGVGACLRQGEVVCDGQAGTRCNAEEGLPSPELCDNIDNDCDGTIDEGLGLGQACLVGAGVCARPGRFECVEGRDQPVCVGEPLPGRDETCNNIDDDCDGSIDEGFNVGNQCFGNDQCRSTGMFRCTEGGNSECIVDNIVPPGPERCDGDDDDCDGFIDENFDLEELCSAGVGACSRDGVAACTGDQEGTTCGAIPGDPSPELCDNIDNDCDGTIDEDLGLGEACTDGVGACQQEGQVVCTPEGGTTCIIAEEGLPSPELCDNIDNDCDGTIDEDLGLGEACTDGVGACNGPGIMVCSPNGDTQCNATPGLPFQEHCAGDDADCDGAVDEGLDCPTWTNPVEVGLGGQWLESAETEVTVGQYSECIAAGACGRPRNTNQARPCNWFLPEETPRRDELPMNCITLENAREYARWIGARVPTRDEVMAVAGSADGRTFAWGDHIPNPVCVAAQYANCNPAGTIPVGSKGDAWDPPSGAKDLHGNVREWTESCNNGECATFGGGCDDVLQSTIDIITRLAGATSYDLGFRVVRDVPPPQ